ncbi:2-amino-4-hydroxy-6-hydroxymethyldihydropteridine diphosphokinase [Xanthobacter tagetidis]|uniref:2-amino-4-hydroxy-6-hydroxymethyldihydropteridine pyrophosphokinase n=1 Tax=Xanthobacter tagetidis TaxID=60216 RepID=A0A3L7ADC6_9HYPH|nr:2-amino-4-hydroxy-6-hydroxymethyldihydropteridine diphosphokinase [Xanthobacter tagetidis]MBB6306184.1 2-amino-4-hydroxy-6-hydroxymethyldihydropteridine diphosphokinase [Xanthobacter tagetidis]RLP77728.1 2-amino-4-hydroxy-6-hydroxymethyldihydropteridine diphosphokinase [Xanthobacter tagetidis]
MPAEALSRRAFLCLGSNVGDRALALGEARVRLEAAGVRLTAVSSLYETPPWGPVPQGPYLNQVVEVASPVGPRALLELALAIERQLGRDRAREVRYGPRRIDIDILWFDGETIAEADLEIPHPRLMERAFVLVPLVEIAPDFSAFGISAKAALAGLDASGIRRLGAAETAHEKGAAPS